MSPSDRSPLRVPVSELRQGARTLDGSGYRYVVRVHRARVGDALLLFDAQQKLEAHARLVALSADGESAELEVDAPQPGRVLAERSVRIVQALPKGDKLDSIVRDATELGASEFWLLHSERCVTQLRDASRASKRKERLARITEEAARQAGRADCPQVLGPFELGEALQRDDAELKVLLSPREHAAPVFSLLTHAEPGCRVSLYVGPEGGFSAREERLAEQHGAQLGQLGPFVLRTETAVAATLGALRLLDHAPGH